MNINGTKERLQGTTYNVDLVQIVNVICAKRTKKQQFTHAITKQGKVLQLVEQSQFTTPEVLHVPGLRHLTSTKMWNTSEMTSTRWGGAPEWIWRMYACIVAAKEVEVFECAIKQVAGQDFVVAL